MMQALPGRNLSLSDLLNTPEQCRFVLLMSFTGILFPNGMLFMFSLHKKGVTLISICFVYKKSGYPCQG